LQFHPLSKKPVLDQIINIGVFSFLKTRARWIVGFYHLIPLNPPQLKGSICLVAQLKYYSGDKKK
jgi:hypothetical protein